MRAGSWIVLVLAAVLPFLTALGNGFVFDDQGVILDHPAVWGPSFWDAWSARYWPNSESAGLYRPLTTASFWIDGRIWGRNATGFLLTNLILHSGVCLALRALLAASFPARKGVAWAAALLFAVHPLHTEAVVGIVGRAELWAALGAVLACRLGLASLHETSPSRRTVAACGSALALLLALHGKESALGVCLLLPFGLFATGPGLVAAAPDGSPGRAEAPRTTTGADFRSRVWALSLFWAGAVALALLTRIRVLGDLFALQSVSRMDNVLSHVPSAERIGAAFYVQAYALLQMIWPRHLSPDYSYPAIVPTATTIVVGIAFSLLLVSAGVVAWRRRDREILWGLVFAAATGLLTSNVLFPIGTVYGERLTYLPSAGILWMFVVLGVRGLSRVRFGGEGDERRRRVLLAAVLAAVAAALAARSALRAPEWRSNLTLFEAASRTTERSAKVWTNLSLARIRAGALTEALAAADRALTLDPDYPAAIQAKGSVLVQLGRPEEALPWLERNRDLPGSRGLESLLELGNAQLALGRGEAARAHFSEARARSRENDERWIVGLASAYALESRWPESRQYWQNAVSLRPEDDAFRQRYAYVLWMDGALEEAERIYRELAREEPEDADRLNELAWFLAVSERGPEEALTVAAEAYAQKKDPNIADTWLEAWLRARGCEEAGQWLRSAASPLESAHRAGLEATWRERCPDGVSQVGEDRSEP